MIWLLALAAWHAKETVSNAAAFLSPVCDDPGFRRFQFLQMFSGAVTAVVLATLAFA